MSDLVFADRKKDTIIKGTWKVLVVDDDPGIHAITRTVLRDLVYDNRRLECISANGRIEAQSLYEANNDIALILLDVVMEENDSGLRFVKFIRENCKNALVRIILRTGHPGLVPSRQIIVDYDINDYEEKTDLTAQKLYTTVIASLRNYRDLEELRTRGARLARHRNGLKAISASSTSLFGARTPEEFVRGAYTELLVLLSGIDKKISSFVAFQDGTGFHCVDGDGDFSNCRGKEPKELLGSEIMESLRVLKREGRNLLIKDSSVFLYEDARKYRLLIHVSGVSGLEVQDYQLLDIYAANVGVAFENMRLSSEIIGTQEDLITRLGEVVETRSHDTAQHVRRVGELCAVLAAGIGMEEDAVHHLKMASALHDIGKIGIPDDILLKPDVLTSEEFDVIRRHTTIGYDLLKNSSKDLLKTGAVICLQHHEKMDGSGYPAGLHGDKIQLNARIVSICDVFDSLVHDRQHRDPWSYEDACSYLREQKGISFDSELVDTFLEKKDKIIGIIESMPD